jgi:hypothetical protein
MISSNICWVTQNIFCNYVFRNHEETDLDEPFSKQYLFDLDYSIDVIDMQIKKKKVPTIVFVYSQTKK